MAGPHSGALPSSQTQRFEELGHWINSCYGDDNRAAHTSGNTTAISGGSGGSSRMVLQLPSVPEGASGISPIDRVTIMEDQAYGQRILSWNVSTDTGLVLGSGRSIGNKRIVVWNATLPAGTTQLVLNVLAAKAQPIIKSFAAYHSCPSE